MWRNKMKNTLKIVGVTFMSISILAFFLEDYLPVDLYPWFMSKYADSPHHYKVVPSAETDNSFAIFVAISFSLGALIFISSKFLNNKKQ